jgi:hypothetical protein
VRRTLSGLAVGVAYLGCCFLAFDELAQQMTSDLSHSLTPGAFLIAALAGIAFLVRLFMPDQGLKSTLRRVLPRVALYAFLFVAGLAVGLSIGHLSHTGFGTPTSIALSVIFGVVLCRYLVYPLRDTTHPRLNQNMQKRVKSWDILADPRLGGVHPHTRLTAPQPTVHPPPLRRIALKAATGVPSVGILCLVVLSIGSAYAPTNPGAANPADPHDRGANAAVTTQARRLIDGLNHGDRSEVESTLQSWIWPADADNLLATYGTRNARLNSLEPASDDPFASILDVAVPCRDSTRVTFEVIFEWFPKGLFSTEWRARVIDDAVDERVPQCPAA